MKPRIFISAVTGEFKTTRRNTRDWLERLGYEPVTQEIFGTESGDLRAALREKIDSCMGLVQIVGDAYGAEPPTQSSELGRVSYTQYEFLYARKTGKKTWLIYAQEGCRRDTPLAELDLPKKDVSDPLAWQAERRSLQTAYRAALEVDGHVRYRVQNDDQLQVAVLGLRDELEVLRLQEQRRQRMSIGIAATTLLTILAIGGLLLWSATSGDGHPNAESIRVRIGEAVDAERREDELAMNAIGDQRRRHESTEAAENRENENRARANSLSASIMKEYRTGDASTEFQEFARRLSREGVSNALEYVEHKKADIVRLAEQNPRSDDSVQRRSALAPLRDAAALRLIQGEYRAAIDLADEIVALDDRWAEPLRAKYEALIERGDRALQASDAIDAGEAAAPDFKAAIAAAERLRELESVGPNRAIAERLRAYRRLGDALLRSTYPGMEADIERTGEAWSEVRESLSEFEPDDDSRVVAPADRKAIDDAWQWYTLADGGVWTIAAIDRRMYEQVWRTPDPGPFAELGSLQPFAEMDSPRPVDPVVRRELAESWEWLAGVDLDKQRMDSALANSRRRLDQLVELEETERERSQVQGTIAEIYLSSLRLDDALDAGQKSLDLAEDVVARGADAAALRDRLNARMRLGRIRLLRAQLTTDENRSDFIDDQRIELELALELYDCRDEVEVYVDVARSDDRSRLDRAIWMTEYATALGANGRPGEAESQFSSAIVELRKGFGDPKEVRRRLSIALTRQGLLRATGKFVDSEPLGDGIAELQEGFDLAEEAEHADSDWETRLNLSIAAENWGRALRSNDQFDEAMEKFRRSFCLRFELARLAPQNMEYAAFAANAAQLCREVEESRANREVAQRYHLCERRARAALEIGSDESPSFAELLSRSSFAMSPFDSPSAGMGTARLVSELCQ